MPNNLFNFPMYMKQQGQESSYGNPLAGLVDDEQDVQEEKPNPFQMIPTRFTPLQIEQRKQRDKINLESLDMPQIEGVPSFNAIRKNPSYTKT